MFFSTHHDNFLYYLIQCNWYCKQYRWAMWHGWGPGRTEEGDSCYCFLFHFVYHSSLFYLSIQFFEWVWFVFEFWNIKMLCDHLGPNHVEQCDYWVPTVRYHLNTIYGSVDTSIYVNFASTRSRVLIFLHSFWRIVPVLCYSVCNPRLMIKSIALPGSTHCGSVSKVAAKDDD